MLRFFHFLTITIILSAKAVIAENKIDFVPYVEAAATLDGLVDFEPPQTADTHYYISGTPRFGCVRFGERFRGQNLRRLVFGRAEFDVLSNNASDPLTPSASHYPNNLILNMKDPVFKSVSLMGVGPAKNNGRKNGEGSVSVIFDTPQNLFGFRYQASYNGGQNSYGYVKLQFFAGDGAFITELSSKLKSDGELAFQTRPGTQLFSGVSITNDDPGGMAFDDFVMRCSVIPIG